MGIKDWFFLQKPQDTIVQFGRYSDLYKTEEKYHSWDKALEAAQSSNYRELIHHFLDYLTNNDGQNVIVTYLENGHINFKIIQGSKILMGLAMDDKVEVYIKIVHAKEPHLAVFRTLLEENFILKYSKYSLDEVGCIRISFQSKYEDINPYKLYYGLKEMALVADHKDDALISQYEAFDPIDVHHLQQVPNEIILAKYEYFQVEVNQLLQRIEQQQLTIKDHVTVLAYECGAFAYKIDYLLRPEGLLMHQVDALIATCAMSDVEELFHKIPSMMEMLHQMQTMSMEAFKKEFYQSHYTFGITKPVEHESWIEMLNNGLRAMQWVFDTNNTHLQEVVCTYQLGRIIYEYALPPYDKELIQLYFKVTASMLANTLHIGGFTKGDKVALSSIQKELQRITQHNTKYDLHWDTQLLSYDLTSFPASFVQFLLQMKIKTT